MQIERAKSRDQVNAYGGLGKVGFDHDNTTKEGEEKDENEENLVPIFSASAMKYVKKIQDRSPEIDEENEELLAEDLDGIEEALE
jgi:hypothetical protein